jgi:hypothetical protein
VIGRGEGGGGAGGAEHLSVILASEAIGITDSADERTGVCAVCLGQAPAWVIIVCKHERAKGAVDVVECLWERERKRERERVREKESE